MTKLTLGRKYVRQKKAKVESVPHVDWNTPIEIYDYDTSYDETETFEDSDHNSTQQEDVVELFKLALCKIKEAVKFLFILQFLHLIVKGQFPFSCIIFTLFL